MAIAKEMNWYIRAGGAEVNGGGYDGTNYPGGTNYADQNGYQLALTDLTSTASTTATSAAGGFTSQMVGNVIRLASGTGTTPGYYVITAYTSATQVTLDRASGTYTAGVGKVGGAHHQHWVYANGGSGTQPSITSPVAAGHTINIRGAGTDDPAIGSPDYTTPNGYWSFPAGDTTSGYIKIVGYNGRPLIISDLFLYNTPGWSVRNVKFANISGGTYGASNGIFNPTLGMTIEDCIFDQNGLDVCSLLLTSGSPKVRECEFRNSGGGAAGSTAMIRIGGSYDLQIYNCWIHDCRGTGIELNDTYGGIIHGCIIADNLGHGISLPSSSSGYGGHVILNNTIDNNSLDGINIGAAASLLNQNLIIKNNIISNHDVASRYGLNIAAGTTAVNDANVAGRINYNNYYNNTSNYHNISAGANDTAVDPQYTNASGDDYSISANI